VAPTAVSWYDGDCWICGEHGRFNRYTIPIGANFCCPSCGASHRYQGQARVLVTRYARQGATCLAELCSEPEFAALRVWEPGQLGPFRPHLRALAGYETSTYRPDDAPGSLRDGVPSQDLMALTYEADRFDLVITSDVFEHVRRPYEGFAEVHRVLRPGGTHVFSIPVFWPMRPVTIPRVDTSGEVDVHLEEPTHHNGHLVYNDFGEDLLDRLDQIGFRTEVVRFPSDNQAAAKLLTFCSVKPPVRVSA
jgi:SAM-dependent methyltransferase